MSAQLGQSSSHRSWVDDAFSRGRLQGNEEARALLESVRHLPRDEAMAELQRQRKDMLASKTSTLEQMDTLRREADLLDSYIEDGTALSATFERWSAGDFVLSRLPHSMIHKVLEAHAKKRMFFGVEDRKLAGECVADFGPRLKRSVPFIIEHDWASAFAGASDFDAGEYRPPFDDTVFEVRMDGRHVCLMKGADGIDVLAVQFGGGWSAMLWNEESPLIFAQLVRAACIALEAEAATFETIRAAEALNRKRIKLGKLPLLDYHVIRLNHRRHAAALPEDEQGHSGRRLRLHFVRGHWRHFEKHKTWIKWHLRGDPDLGFIDKHYRL